jgi:hypothetical protein
METVINTDALIFDLNQMQDHPTASKSAPAATEAAGAVAWSDGPGNLPEALELTQWLKGGETDIEAIRAKLPPYLLELMDKSDVSGERSLHCHHVMMELCEHGLTDDEIFRVSGGQPFSAKFWSERGARGLCKEIARARKQWIEKGSVDRTASGNGTRADRVDFGRNPRQSHAL